MKKQIRLSTALMLILLTVVSTFNITFYIAGEHYNARLGDLTQTEDRYSKIGRASCRERVSVNV